MNQQSLDEMAAVIGYQMIENRMLRRENVALEEANRKLTEQTQKLLAQVKFLTEPARGD